MRNWKPATLAGIILCLSVGGARGDGAQLDLFEFARSDSYTGSQFDLHTAITLYPDGLIRTLSASSFSLGARKMRVVRSLSVARVGDTIYQFSGLAISGTPEVTYQISDETVAVRTARMKSTDVLVLQHVRGLVEGQNVYEFRVNGELRYGFTLASGSNTIEVVLKSGRTVYRVTADPTRVPIVRSEGVDRSEFQIGQIGASVYYIVVTETDGQVLASYRVEGAPLTTSPLVGILNFLIYGNLIDGPVVYPFLGGMPEP